MCKCVSEWVNVTIEICEERQFIPLIGDINSTKALNIFLEDDWRMKYQSKVVATEAAATPKR